MIPVDLLTAYADAEAESRRCPDCGGRTLYDPTPPAMLVCRNDRCGWDAVLGDEPVTEDYTDGLRDGLDASPLRSRPTGMYSAGYADGYSAACRERAAS